MTDQYRVKWPATCLLLSGHIWQGWSAGMHLTGWAGRCCNAMQALAAMATLLFWSQGARVCARH